MVEITNKLTATLSDGSEWEVDVISDIGEEMTVNLRPIKREPREFLIHLDSRTIISCKPFSFKMYDSKTHIKVREVLE